MSRSNQGKSGFCLFLLFAEVNTMDIPEDPPLVLHQPASLIPLYVATGH